MTLPAWPTIPSILPESAPFTPEQRTWLNGFFAGFLSLDGAVTPLSPEEAAQLMPGLVAPLPCRPAPVTMTMTKKRLGTTRQCCLPSA